MKAELLLGGLVAAPALGAVVLLALGGSRERFARWVALASASLTAALGWGLVRAIALAPSHALELRAPLFAGVTFALGADATGIAAIAVVALAAPLAVVLGRGSLGLIAAVLLALLSLDGIVTLLALSASTSLVLVEARRAGVERAARRRFALGAALGIAAFGAALVLLRVGAGELAGPSPWLAPELARVPWLARHPVAFGLPVVTTAWSLAFVAAAALGGLAPFHLASSALLDERHPVLATSVGVFFLRLGPALLLRWVLPILPEGSRWAAPAVMDWAVVATVLAAASAHGRRPLAGAVAFANALGFAAGASLGAQGFAALMVHGAASAAALALALAFGARGRAARLLIASGAGVGGVLAITGIAVRSPALAAVATGALVGAVMPATSFGAEQPRFRRALAALAAVILVVVALGAVDRVAPGVRVLGERLERAGGDGAGS